MKKYVLILLCFNSYLLFAQQNAAENDSAYYENNRKEIKNIYTGTAYRGLSIHADVFSPVMGILSNKDVRTFEIQTDINIYDKFFPILEAGYGSIATTIPSGVEYISGAPFFRLGMNYGIINNATKKGEPKIINSYPFIGLRYGLGLFNYEINNAPLNSGYWGNNKLYNFQKNAIYGGWLEIIGGIRVDIFKGLTMGWSVRLKTLFHSKDKNKIWWNAGYGFTQSSQFAFNYTIGYTFRTKQEREKRKSICQK